MAGTDIQLGRRVLREEIKAYLVDAIMRGAFKPGERIVETRIANQLGVSQAPVREAIRDLESLGLVESMPFRGASVRQLSLTELAEIYPVRAAIEGVAARAAATRMTEADLERLEELNRAMLAAAEQGDSQGQTRYNIEFHRMIVEASGNTALVRIWNTLQLATWTFVTVGRSGHTLMEIARRHEAVIAALRSRDPDLAEQTLRRHIEEAGTWVRSRAEQERCHEGENGG